LTEDEKDAISMLKIDGGATNEESDGDVEMTVAEKIKAGKRKQREETAGGEDQYHNSDFILGSAAEVERLWSHAGLVLTKSRRSMTPMLLEAILFLKCNRRFWDQNLVAEAFAMQRTARSQRRINDDVEQLNAGRNDE
jgi:hypothetical protein